MKRAYLVESDADAFPTSGGKLNQPRFTLDTVVDDEGLNLSVGERSLVSLARALVRDAKVSAPLGKQGDDQR